MTRQEAESLGWRDEVQLNAIGHPFKARVNGKMKTWKTRPNDWLLPMKHGLYDYFYIGEIEDPFNAPQKLSEPEKWRVAK